MIAYRNGCDGTIKHLEPARSIDVFRVEQPGLRFANTHPAKFVSVAMTGQTLSGVIRDFGLSRIRKYVPRYCTY